MVDKTVLDSIGKLVETLREKDIYVKKIVLYGSYATGTAKNYSDIDVALISDKFGKDRAEERMFLLRLASSIDPRLEPLPLSIKVFENENWIPLVYEIHKNGIDVSKMIRK